MRRIALCATLAVAAIAPNVRAYDQTITAPGAYVTDGKRPRRGNYEARLRARFSK